MVVRRWLAWLRRRVYQSDKKYLPDCEIKCTKLRSCIRSLRVRIKIINEFSYMQLKRLPFSISFDRMRNNTPRKEICFWWQLDTGLFEKTICTLVMQEAAQHLMGVSSQQDKEGFTQWHEVGTLQDSVLEPWISSSHCRFYQRPVKRLLPLLQQFLSHQITYDSQCLFVFRLKRFFQSKRKIYAVSSRTNAFQEAVYMTSKNVLTVKRTE